jgi:nucleoside-diphosphate-sugar epimerase
MDLLRPARDGTLNVLEAAANTPSIRRVIITSTMAAISHIGSGPIPGKIYTVSGLMKAMPYQQIHFNLANIC